jgi:hypothetical protein
VRAKRDTSFKHATKVGRAPQKKGRGLGPTLSKGQQTVKMLCECGRTEIPVQPAQVKACIPVYCGKGDCHGPA